MHVMVDEIFAAKAYSQDKNWLARAISHSLTRDLFA
jgi:hypothetical protein